MAEESLKLTVKPHMPPMIGHWDWDGWQDGYGAVKNPWRWDEMMRK
jgi:hypothetical protein